MQEFEDRARLARLVSVIAASTAALTASFIGLVALASGEATGTVARLPGYVLSMAIVFLGAIILFEESDYGGRQTIRVAAAGALTTLFVVTLGVEGVLFALENPDAVVRSQLFAYLLSAGLMGTGFGYWGWCNWESVRPKGINDSL